jgi:hypothetical protein
MSWYNDFVKRAHPGAYVHILAGGRPEIDPEGVAFGQAWNRLCAKAMHEAENSSGHGNGVGAQVNRVMHALDGTHTRRSAHRVKARLTGLRGTALRHLTAQQFAELLADADALQHITATA